MNETKAMIHCHYKDGQKLNVEDLNVITVLVDRSQTVLTEIGWNAWRAGLEGPPHSHAEKDQVFYITEGRGRIVFGATSFPVQPGDLVYVPMGRAHQTVVEGADELAYVLYNFFRDSGKEGHGSFSEHIEKVKHERKAQASAGWGERVANRGDQESHGKPEVFRNLPSIADDGNQEILDRGKTLRCAARLRRVESASPLNIDLADSTERTAFVLSGSGSLSSEQGSNNLKNGDFIYLPPGTPYTLKSREPFLTMLEIDTLLE